MKIPKKSREKNPENPKIPGIGIGILKPLKNPEKIPRAKSRKSRNPGDRDRDLKIPKKSRENPEKIPSEKSRKSQNPGDRDLFFRDIPGISRSGGTQELEDPITFKETLLHPQNQKTLKSI